MQPQMGSTAQPERSPGALRRRNRDWIFSIIAQNTPITRGQISEITGLTGAAVSRISRDLIDAGLVLEGDPIAVPGRVGRREYNLTLNAEGAYVLGFSITASRKSVTLANASGDIVAATDCNDLPAGHPDQFLDQIVARAMSLLDKSNFDRSRLLGAGVSAAITSQQTDENGIVLIQSDPLGWQDVALNRALSERLNMVVHVEQRAAAMLRGELRKLTDGESVFLIDVGLGIGASAFLGGRLTMTADQSLGPFWHYSDHVDNRICSCGRRGCLEVTATGKAILADLGLLSDDTSQNADRLSAAIDRADGGDRDCAHAFALAGAAMARGVDAVLALLQPDIVILAGEVGRQKHYHQAVCDGLVSLGRPASETIVRRSTILSQDAAVSVALQNFLFSGELDILSFVTA